MNQGDCLSQDTGVQLEGRWLGVLLLTSILLSALLPIGLVLPLHGPVWQGIFVSHLALSILSSLLCLQIIWTTFSPTKLLRICSLVALIFVALFVGAESLHPVLARDALIHHLAVPQWWLQRDQIYAIDWHEWSFYPMLLNLGYTGLLSRGFERVCTLYHAQYLLYLATAVLCMLRHLGCDKALQLFGLSLCLTLPILIHLAATPLVDLGLAAFSACALLALIRIFSHSNSIQRNALMVGAFLGLAMACKYNGFLFAVVFLAWCLVATLRLTHIASRVRILAVFLLCATAFLLISPWLLKNFFWTGNPVYPLAKGIFGGASGGGPSVTALDREMSLYDRSLIDVLLIPLTMLFKGQDDNPQYFDGVLSPILILVVFAVISVRNRASALLLLAIAVSYFLVAFSSSGSRIRYLVPLAAPVIVLCILGLEELQARCKKAWLVPALGCFSVLWSLYYCYGHVTKTQSLSYLFRRLAATQEAAALDKSYLRTNIPEYKAIEYVNREVPRTQKVYLLFTSNLFYYFEPTVFSGGYLSEGPLLRWLKSSSNVDALAKEFNKQEVSYLLVNVPRLQRALPLTLKENEVELWNGFEKQYLRLLAHDGVTALWALQRPSPPSSQEAS